MGPWYLYVKFDSDMLYSQFKQQTTAITIFTNIFSVSKNGHS